MRNPKLVTDLKSDIDSKSFIVVPMSIYLIDNPAVLILYSWITPQLDIGRAPARTSLDSMCGSDMTKEKQLRQQRATGIQAVCLTMFYAE